MRRSLFHMLLVLATAPAVLSVSAASSASAVTAPQVSGHEAAGRSAPLALAGGLRAVPVQGAGLQGCSTFRTFRLAGITADPSGSPTPGIRSM